MPRNGDDPTIEDVLFFSIVDLETGDEHIPVFNDYNECNQYVTSISATKPDSTMAIFACHALDDIERKIWRAFGRPIRLVVNTEPDEEDLDTEEEPTWKDNIWDSFIHHLLGK